MKSIFASLVFCVLLFGGVSEAKAQVIFQSEAEYRTYALELIEVLLARIEQLEAQLAAQKAVEELQTVVMVESILLSDSSEVKALYDLTSDAPITDRTHKAIVNRLFEVVPEEFDDYFLEFLVFEDSEHGFDAFVETIAPYDKDTWRLAVSTETMMIDPDSAIMTELLVHEFGHVVSYDAIPEVPNPSIRRCHDYFERFGCPPRNSYLYDFIDTFWEDDELDIAESFLRLRNPFPAIEKFYEKNERDFVSEYAASSPEEDFAETFALFVLESRPTRNRVQDHKIDFFYDYPELVSIRAEVRSNI